MLHLLSVSICLLGFSGALWGQADAQRNNGRSRSGIPGYLDPRTGVFKPVPLVLDENPDAAAVPPTCTLAPCTGTITVTIKITIKSTNLPTTDAIACEVDAGVIDNIASLAGARSFTEVASVQATRTSSTAATCTVKIPYSWNLITPTLDMVSIGYTVSVPGLFFATTNALPNRFSSVEPYEVVHVPPSTTPINITTSATI